MEIGAVKYYDQENGYGYIRICKKDTPDLRFLSTNPDLNVGDTVHFTVHQGQYKPYANIISIIKRNIAKYNTEDKKQWCRDGEQNEFKFIEEIVPFLSFSLDIHPEKKKGNKYHMDLIDLDTGLPADLKKQSTPFFTAKRIDPSLDPTYTVTFNKKDYENYTTNYPNSKIFWWVKWGQLTYGDYEVEPIDGVWLSEFQDMANMISNCKVKLHEYQNRVNDEINAKDSYLFDLRSGVFKELLRFD